AERRGVHRYERRLTAQAFVSLESTVPEHGLRASLRHAGRSRALRLGRARAGSAGAGGRGGRGCAGNVFRDATGGFVRDWRVVLMTARAARKRRWWRWPLYLGLGLLVLLAL